MKRKVLIFSILFLFIFSNFVFSFSSDKYSIDIPDGYQENKENSFTNEEGKNINVGITKSNQTVYDADIYTEENLEEIFNKIEDQLEYAKKELKKQLNQQNKSEGLNLTEKQIDDYVETFKIEKVVKKEVTTFSKNNYKCFHIIIKYSMGESSYYTDTYQVQSGNEIYTLAINEPNLEDINTDTHKKVVNSFTIKNFKPIKIEEKSLTERAMDEGISGALSSAILCGGIILVSFIGKKFKKNSEETKDASDEPKEDTSDTSKQVTKK